MKEHIKKDNKSHIFKHLHSTTICFPSRHAIFREYSLSDHSTWKCSRHPGNILKKNIFKKIINGKVAFVLKMMYDLTITNAYLLANSSNHKAMFPEHSKNIPQIYVSKNSKDIPRIL